MPESEDSVISEGEANGEKTRPTVFDIEFIRHAERTNDGAGKELTPEGRQDAEKFGKGLIELDDGTKVYCSPREWTMETAEVIRENLVEPEGYQLGKRGVLKPSFSKPLLDQMYAWREDPNLGNDGAMAKYISLGKKPDEESASPVEIARVVAARLERLCRIASLNRFSGKNLSLPHIAHDFTIMPFLAIIFKGDIESNPINPEGKNIVEKMGGSLKPLEGFHAVIKKAGDEEPIVSISFRNWSKELTHQQLKQIAAGETEE